MSSVTPHPVDSSSPEGKAPEASGGDSTPDSNQAWLTLAEQAFRMSTDYMDANLRRQWERNVSNLMGKHPKGSKYLTAEYKRRSRLFRPKTRSAERDFEAAVAVAFFASQDVATVTPEHPKDEVQVASADINHYLLNYHLTKKVPWFKSVIGAAQDAWVYGIVWSEQTWKYEVRKGADGTDEVVEDRPDVRIIPPENMRVDSACDWLDPVGSSPYLIELIPMYITDVLDKMDRGNERTGESKWKRLTEAQLQTTRRIEHEGDATRVAREGKTPRDRMDNQHTVTAYDIVWIHKNIIDVRGVDYIYFTAGTQHMLTDPEPLVKTYPNGRPYVLGNVILDTHRVHPSSVGELSQDLQSQANSYVNQQIDNGELSMNSRLLVERSAGVDREALKRSVPGGVVAIDDLAGVKELKSSDVTRSSYEMQDRLNVDFDDIAGSFSTSSVASNRKLNETVGGMNLLSQGSDSLTEYQIRVFTETWYEPVIRQILRLIQRYETDERRLAIAADKAKLYQKFGIDKVTDELLMQDLTSSISVGFAATNPQKRIERLMLAVKTMEPLLRPGEMNRRELSKEVFGAAGYKDGTRFVDIPEKTDQPDQPRLPPEQIKAEAQIKLAQMQIDDNKVERASKLQLVELERSLKTFLVEKDKEIELIRLAAQSGLSREQILIKAKIEGDKLKARDREIATNVALKQEDRSYDPGKSLSQ